MTSVPPSDPSSGPASARPNAGPVGSGDYVVRQGDCLHSIAWRLGVDPSVIWDHSANATLRDRRGDGILLPGDRLTVPEPAERPSFTVSEGGTHRFQAKIPRMELRLKLEHGDEPRANMPYTAMVDGVRHEGTTGGDGSVTVPVRPGTRFATLTIHEEGDDYEFDDVMELDLGGLDPADDATGIQARLRNLGYSVGQVDGAVGPRTREAIETFQRRQGLEVTGEADEATRQRLSELHGI